jgi:2-polyprenyl-6-methoxyphenol hydroxylase-like FAD-dependent oxidoreductase
VAEPDVLVCGAGCAGLAAAVAAARMGASTMAVEQFGFAGGFMTAVMSTGVDGLCDMTTGEVVVGGVALEVLERLGVLALPLASRKLFDPMLDETSIDRHPAKLPVRIGNIERFKLVADALLMESGVRVLYHTKLIDVVTSGSGVGDVIIGNKDGIAAIRPKVVIDCTGDADIAAWAGAPCEMEAVPQPGSLHFRVGNVKVTSEADDLYALTRRCAGALEQVHAAGEFGLYAGPWLSPSGPGEVMFNAVRLPFDSTSAEETTRAEMNGRRDAWAMFELWRDRLPEFAGSHFVTSGPTVGARESRRIAGGYTLTADDILTSRPFPDAIARGSWYIDRHPSESSGFHRHVTVKAYDIPYRTLLPHGVDNLLVAGRCHSATPEALASSRVNMTAMAMGQAAGVAAALAVQGDRSPADVDVEKLRRDLLQQGAVLDG